MAKSRRTWNLHAYDSEPGLNSERRFHHVGPEAWVRLHQLAQPIVPIQLVEDPKGPYWGFLRKNAEYPTMIWPSELQFRMCFPYGPEVEVQQGGGHILRFRVEQKGFA